jgi:CheY-like chemotaxis protein
MEHLKSGTFLIGVASFVLAGLVRMLLGTVISEEWKAWAPRWAAMLVRGAVKLLPRDKRERYLEEWTAAVSDIPGYLAKLLYALDLYRAGFLISRQSDRTEAQKAVTNDAEAIKVASPAKIADTPLRARDISKEGPRPRVLVIDDEPVIANTLAIILEQCGYDAKSAHSGEAGIAIARNFKPETLIADVVMTGMTGIEAAIQIRSMLPKCDIWLFAGQAATSELIERAARTGHKFNVLNKPVHPNEILNRIRHING